MIKATIPVIIADSGSASQKEISLKQPHTTLLKAYFFNLQVTQEWLK
jgi:hypothetical protein